VSSFSFLCHRDYYATKNKKTIRKNINTKKILIISHLLEDMLFRYFNKAPCAPSTFASVSSMFSSILPIKQPLSTPTMSLDIKTRNKQKSVHLINNQRTCATVHIKLQKFQSIAARS